MRQVRFLEVVVALLLSCAAASADAPRHFEGAVTLYQPDHSQIVVCTVSSPELCNMLRLYGGTKAISATTGKPVSLARGQFVAVDAQMQAGQPVATVVKVFPDRVVRAISNFQLASAGSVSTTLRKIPGVRNITVNSLLGEAVIVFNPAATSPALIERAAALHHVKLALPG